MQAGGYSRLDLEAAGPGGGGAAKAPGRKEPFLFAKRLKEAGVCALPDGAQEGQHPRVESHSNEEGMMFFLN